MRSADTRPKARRIPPITAQAVAVNQIEDALVEAYREFRRARRLEERAVASFDRPTNDTSLETTHIYAESDLEMKAEAFARCEAPLLLTDQRRSNPKGSMGILRTV